MIPELISFFCLFHSDLFIDGDIGVAQPGQEGGAGDGGWPTAQECHLATGHQGARRLGVAPWLCSSLAGGREHWEAAPE